MLSLVKLWKAGAVSASKVSPRSPGISVAYKANARKGNRENELSMCHEDVPRVKDL